MKKTVLILTGKFGSGHISVAHAIKEVIEDMKDVNVEIIDIVDYAFPLIAKSIYKNFNGLVEKSPNLYNAMNKLADGKNTGFINVVALKRIKRLIDHKNPTAIVSVLPLSSQMISYYKGKYSDETPLYTIVTDICSHNEWIADNTDKYFIADESIKKNFVEKGVVEDKLIVSGIPIRNKFKINTNKKFSSKKRLLVMGGGLGLIPNCEDVLERLNEDEGLSVTVITGHNKVLKDQIAKSFMNIRVMGFTESVAEEMKNADLIISKAGGITVFESIHMERPLLVINPFLAQEKNNAKFIEEKGIGKVFRNKSITGDEIVDKIKFVLSDDRKMSLMHNNLKVVKNRIMEYNEKINSNLKVS